MGNNWEDISRLDIKLQKSYYLAYNIGLPSCARVLVSWQDNFLFELLKDSCRGIQIDCLMDMDFAAFVQEVYSDNVMIYDYIVDNGLLAQTGMDAALLKAMGMHLLPGGRVRSVFPSYMERGEIAKVAFVNNFGDGRCLGVTEAEAQSFYVAEFSRFKQGVAWLQNFYTPELRRKLAWLLQRLDFGLDVEETLSAIRQMCCQHSVTSEYLSVMADIATIHAQQVKKMLFSQ